eukprot:364905-Chlamydomonas_euryale.AAC.21
MQCPPALRMGECRVCCGFVASCRSQSRVVQLRIAAVCAKCEGPLNPYRGKVYGVKEEPRRWGCLVMPPSFGLWAFGLFGVDVAALHSKFQSLRAASTPRANGEQISNL